MTYGDDYKIHMLGADDTYWINKLSDVVAVFTDESSIYKHLNYSKSKYRRYVRESINDGSCYLLCLKGDDVVGFTAFFFDENYIDAVNMEIETIYVLPDYRRTRAARLLCDKINDIMLELDCDYSHVSICASFSNQGSLIDRLTENLFNKYGYKKIGIVMGKGK